MTLEERIEITQERLAWEVDPTRIRKLEGRLRELQAREQAMVAEGIRLIGEMIEKGEV